MIKALFRLLVGLAVISVLVFFGLMIIFQFKIVVITITALFTLLIAYVIGEAILK